MEFREDQEFRVAVVVKGQLDFAREGGDRLADAVRLGLHSEQWQVLTHVDGFQLDDVTDAILAQFELISMSDPGHR
jgi:hypothetical protein